MQAAQGAELGGRKIRKLVYPYLLVAKTLTMSKISNSAEHRRRGIRKTVTSESAHQIGVASAVLVERAAAAWIGTMAGRGTRAEEETTIARAVPNRPVATMAMDAADAIVATVAPTTVTLALDHDLDRLDMAGTGRIPTDVGVPVRADVVQPNLIWTSHNDMGNRFPTFSCSFSRRYGENSSAGLNNRSSSVD